MKSKPKTYSLVQIASAICMMMALLWLTISTPFVYATQLELAKQNITANAGSPLSASEEEASNPFGNTTEEKSPNSGSASSEEYLHDHHTADNFLSIDLEYHKCEKADTYNAFHGELLVPPPNA